MTSVFSQFSSEVMSVSTVSTSSIPFPFESESIPAITSPEATSATTSYAPFSLEGTTAIPSLLTTTTNTDQSIYICLYTTSTKSNAHEAIHSSTLLSNVQSTTPPVTSTCLPEVTVSSPNLMVIGVSLTAALVGAIIALVASIALNVFLCIERRWFVKQMKGTHIV